MDVKDLQDPENRIRTIGDVTCDIMGSIKSTLRPSTHTAPYYDYDPESQQEASLFSKKSNITVMAVDTCPNALPKDASRYFGNMLIPNVLKPLLEGSGHSSKIITGATIVKEGQLTPKFSYLTDFSKG